VDEPKLRSMIARGESSTVEFKRDDLRPEQLAREIAAMANGNGGMILLGVEDDGSISGLRRANLQEWIFDTVVGRYVHPAILPNYEEVFMGGVRVGVLALSQGVSKPYVVRDRDREDIYVRAGSVCRRASREQQVRLCADGGLLHTEILPVSGTSLASLDLVRLENYLRDILRDPEVPDSDTEWIERLLALGFLTSDASGERVATIAGLVLFGIRPRRSLRQAGIRLMVFGGGDKEYQALLDVALDAPMVGRWQVDGRERRLIDDGLVEKFTDAVAPFISEEASGIDAAFRREKTWFYPREAVRETVVNALAHRDWTRFVDIEVGVYNDRMEVVSPGALPNSMSIEKMIAGQRSMRNQIITEVLRDYGYVDARGMGVRTKIIPLMRASGRDPSFEATEDFLRTVLWRAVPESKTPPNLAGPTPIIREPGPQEMNAQYLKGALKGQFNKKDPLNDLLLTLKNYPTVTYEETAEMLGTSPATVKRRIQKLKRDGRLRRLGSKKTGVWQVV
jgi:ATP-dependent DNA helicase RecG